MNFLDEKVTISKNDPDAVNKAAELEKKGVDSSIEEKKKKHPKKRPDYADVDGDGDRNEPMAKAFKDKKSVKEGIMSELDILAQEASSVEEFLQNVYTQYPQHEGNPQAENFLIDFYNQSNSLEELNITGEYQGRPSRMTGDDFYDLLQAGLKVANSPQAFVNYITYGITDETSQLSLEDQQKLKDWYVQNKQMEEGKLKNILTGAALLATLLGINKVTSEKIYNGDTEIQDLTSKYEKAKEDGDEKAMAEFKEKIETRKAQWDTGKVDETLKEASKTVELPADTTFTLDLKHLMKKHMDEGKSQEDVVKLTKALMQKLHDKGEVKVNGTKVIFKESATQTYVVKYQVGSDVIDQYKRVEASSEEEAIRKVKREVEDFSKPGANYIARGVDGKDIISATPVTNELADTPLSLPKPSTRDYLGDDGMDYEGGMAKSQLLKMKKYAMALCDMVDDESQLEAWVQAKITKASDYMSAVFHYLDYQNSKMNEAYIDSQGNLQDFDPEGTVELDDFIKALEKSSNIQEFSRYFKDPQAVFNKTVDFILDSDLASKIDLDDWHNTGDKVWNDFRWFSTPRTLQQLYMKLRNFL